MQLLSAVRMLPQHRVCDLSCHARAFQISCACGIKLGLAFAHWATAAQEEEELLEEQVKDYADSLLKLKELPLGAVQADLLHLGFALAHIGCATGEGAAGGAGEGLCRGLAEAEGG